MSNQAVAVNSPPHSTHRLAAAVDLKGAHMPWLFAAVAICSELGATLGLRHVATNRSWWAIVLVATAYLVCFSSLGVALKSLNVGVIYAIWSGIGTAAIAVAGAVLFGERLNWQAAGGMVLIVAGVCVLVLSGTVRHS